MLTIRTAAQVRGARHLRGFRSCAASTGVLLPRAQEHPRVQAEAGLERSEARRRWLARQWENHQMRARRGRRA